MRAYKKNEGSGIHSLKYRRFPRPIIAKRQRWRKYYIMRRLSFQAVSVKNEKRKDGPKVENILEMLFDLPREKIYSQDSPFGAAARVREKKLERLTASLTEEQQELLGAYIDARSEVEDRMYFDRFRFAFHFGAQIMAELIEGRGEVL
jgi:hypothetical protein